MRRRLRRLAPPSRRLALVTGGAGFIGTHVAARLLESGFRVRILDNLSQAGVEANLQFLCATYGSRVDPVIADIRHRPALKAALDGVSQVYHLAAHVAADSGLGDPTLDFSVNAGGTLNLLEELRALAAPPSLLFTSTKRVYGALDDVDLVREGDGYLPASPRMRECGVNERRRVAFHSPHGCSKGVADQYVLNYVYMFGLPAVVFRLSCIYGPHQFGTAQHGWVAELIVRSLEDQPITIFGDGLQVRDVLFIDDLVDAMVTAHDRIQDIAGEAFNVGGGPGRSISLIELVKRIEKLNRRRAHVEYGNWRQGDPRYYVSDTRKLHAATRWQPRTTLDVGVAAVYDWLQPLREASSRRPLASRYNATVRF